MIKQNVQFLPHEEHIFIVISQNRILKEIEQTGLLQESWQQLTFLHEYRDEVVEVGNFEDKRVFVVDMGNEQPGIEKYETVSLRSMLLQLPTHWFEIVSKAWQTALFLRTHRFCGQCGSRMQNVGWELAVHCDTCQHRCYPRISPCIIVAIRKGNQILLAQGKNHTGGMFSTLAGFVESGETLEQAVHREVYEEVSVKVKNLQYFSSQPWPFPHSLMCGFLAEYDSGEIAVDGDEIVEAHWFDFDDLPKIPPVFSIAGQLIQATLKGTSG